MFPENRKMASRKQTIPVVHQKREYLFQGNVAGQNLPLGQSGNGNVFGQTMFQEKTNLQVLFAWIVVHGNQKLFEVETRLCFDQMVQAH
jgi:hypothetical protein